MQPHGSAHDGGLNEPIFDQTHHAADDNDLEDAHDASPLENGDASTEQNSHGRPYIGNDVAQPHHNGDLQSVLQSDQPKTRQRDAAYAEGFERHPPHIFPERVVDLDHEPEDHLHVSRRHPGEKMIAKFGAFLYEEKSDEGH